MFGGEGHFTWSALDASLFLDITISFVVQALSPLILHTHPDNCTEETHFLMSSLCRGFISKKQTNDCKPKLLCRRRTLSLRNVLIFLSPPLLFGLVVGLSNWARLLFGLCLLTASEFFISTRDSCGLMRGSEPSKEIPYPQLYGPM